MSDDEELAAVERCLSGESRAFETIVDSYQRVLFNVALRMVNDRDDAQEHVSPVVHAFSRVRAC